MRLDHCLSRKRWELSFLAEPEEVAVLRRVVRTHLTLWGFPELIDEAQLCVSELVANVIRHVGVGTPVTLAVSTNRTRLRIELSDPDTRALPTLLGATDDQESGRGLALLDSVTAGWGVYLREDTKVTWCELDAGLVCGAHVTRADAVLTLYGSDHSTSTARGATEETAVQLITDVLHWLRAHGHDPDTALDHARKRFCSMPAQATRWN
ncbi:ATP-binding protein [Streptomyces macrosporus]|uniref:Histidine kinase/HSP90-like ATPase domain-containing protein n=1 Tax=Streptomyces macrosporus TaxID=44032 RepID=A0ABN3KGH6_9ACTN